MGLCGSIRVSNLAIYFSCRHISFSLSLLLLLTLLLLACRSGRWPIRAERSYMNGIVFSGRSYGLPLSAFICVRLGQGTDYNLET
ncbi:hypothetical protein F4821DRAFT_110817 [Hypoxylon rubiginosum]|uniref:Uncharacterized protein n=1 Tax=Hypoxylon rubiginosum TaxID=110542 RepID=A0ACC0DJ42_9PEZI|nr:hypothetical protein F4821DRAFT_110817 [Hypoxylon rubiginosum]